MSNISKLLPGTPILLLSCHACTTDGVSSGFDDSTGDVYHALIKLPNFSVDGLSNLHPNEYNVASLFCQSSATL